MKTIAKTTATVLMISFLSLSSAFAMDQTLTGVISDSMCGRKHMMPGKTDAQCTHECIKAKSKYALVTADKVYTLEGSATEFDKLAGKQVQVTGDVQGTNLKVSKISSAK